MLRFDNLRARFSYANIVATLALFIALGGTAGAAKKYLITSPSQIKPAVLNSLKGKDGAQGPAGPAGPRGESGAQGERGATGATGGSGGPSAILVRAHSGPAVATAATDPRTTPAFTAVPLVAASWTQQAGDLNQLIGEVRLKIPDRTDCGTNPGGYENPANAIVRIRLDGVVVGAVVASTAFGSSPVKTLPISWGDVTQYPSNVMFDGVYQGRDLGVKFAPGSDTPHVLSADAADTCGLEGGAATKHFSVEAVAVYALAAH